VSLYGGYSESFFPPPALLNADSLAGDAAFQPEKGVQYEVGIKTSTYDERLSATFAVFDLTRENVLTADPLDIDLSVQTGEQRSRGIELDARGTVFSNLDIIATLTVLDAEVTEDNRFEIGNRLPNTSRLSGSLWAKYQVEQGRFQNMKLGIGVFAQSERQGNLSNSYTAPGFYRVDAFVSYPFNDHVDFSLNIKNLFDRDYIASALGNTINPAEPLSVLARILLRY
jgi:iron complex outermembrane receptor protein